MSRPLALAFVATLLASCKSYPKVDPIYGRQTIPSQRTGSLGAIVPREGTPPPQYYDQGAPAQGNNNLPAAPGAGGGLEPPGGYGFQGSSSRSVTPDSGASSGWNRPGNSFGDAGAGSASGIPPRSTGPDDSIRRSAPESSSYGQSRYESAPAGLGTPPSSSVPPPPTSGSGAIPSRTNEFPAAPGSGADNWGPGTGTPFRSTGYDRVAKPGPGAPSDGQAGRTRDLASAPSALRHGEVVDIMDLPARGSLHPDDGSLAREVRPSGYAAFAAPQETTDRPAAEASSSVPESGAYDYDPGYRWLKGHLEYSPTNRRWKLRYIPITGRTDQYGGSVMLEDSPAIQEMRPGDAAMVEGQIAGDSEPDSFAPLYRVTRIQPLR